MRLIDADELLQKVGAIRVTDDIFNLISEIYETIKNQPTAYDVEKVVAELEEKELLNSSAQAEAQNGMCGNLANYYCGNKDAYNNAIEIVRKGGVK